MTKNIWMSAYNEFFDREKAIRLSAECLRDTRVAFFPLDIRQVLLAFSFQVDLTPYRASLERFPFDPQTISEDGFGWRIQDVLMDPGTGPVTGNNWEIYFNDEKPEARIRFTLMHEMGHILLGHYQTLNTDNLSEMKGDPKYRVADRQANQFSINALAPAPAAYRLLKEHGFSYSASNGGVWIITNSQAPFLRNLGSEPTAGELVMTAFGLSKSAAQKRLTELREELEIWKDLDPELYRQIEGIPHRSGWYCWVCHTRRRTTSLYCPGCGRGRHYEYKDFGKPSRPVIGLRENGQFAFCSVCGNTEYPEDAAYCPVCGCPVINECGNASYTVGDFIRSGMEVIQGTHHCRPNDIYCGTCGVLTAFGQQHGPRENMWLPHRKSERCRTRGTSYPSVLPTAGGRLLKCPSCGSEKTIRNGRYCADCFQPLENCCVYDGAASHACDPNDRYCRICGKPTVLYQAGFLPDYTETETFQALRQAEAESMKPPTIQLMIGADGTTTTLKRRFARADEVQCFPVGSH